MGTVSKPGHAPIFTYAAAIIAVSEHSKCDIIKFYGISQQKIRVIPHGVDHERFRPGAALDAGWARSLGIEDGYVLHVGTLTQEKYSDTNSGNCRNCATGVNGGAAN